MNTKGPWNRCRFRLSDVICPDQRDVLMRVTSQLEVTGEIAFMSDHGEEPDRFSVIDVEGISSPLVIPSDKLRPVEVGMDQKECEERTSEVVKKVEKAAV